MKIDGLWTIEFISTLHLVGSGIVVLHNNRLLGGDEGFYYSGRYDTQNGRICGTINVTRHNPKSLSVFGNIGQFTMKMEGEVQDYSIEGTACIQDKPDQKLRIVCTKKEEL
jgi:hypothetical protein